MKLFREYALKKFNRWGAMYSESQIDDFIPGYKGLYAYSEDDADLIRSSRTSRGFSRFKPYADRLTIDIDGSVEDLKHNLKILVGKGYGVRVFRSGGVDSFHLEVPHAEGWIGHDHLPYSHRRVILDLGLRCDMCLYQHGRIFRMEGMVHEKTRVKKALVKIYPGDPIDVPIVQEPEKQFFAVSVDPDDLGLLLMSVACRASQQPVKGERHLLLWGIASDFFKLGMGFEAVLDFCQAINRTWQHAKTEDEVTHAVQGAHTWAGGTSAKT